MALPVIKIELDRKGLGITAREASEARKRAYARTAKKWWDDMLEDHFKTSATGKYGYAKRTKKYMIRKARQKGHQNPLVFSGRMKQRATSIRDIRATSKGGKAVLSGMPKHTFQFKVSKPVKKAVELITTTSGEVEKLRRFMEDAIVEEINAIIEAR